MEKHFSEVINWFKEIDNKNKHCFLKVYIVDFYPSSTKELLLNAHNFAKYFIDIPPEYEDIIMYCRKWFLFDKKDVWAKQHDSDFDVTMGSFDGAGICELVGLYLLHLLKKECGSSSIGLYRDGGLACYKKPSGPQTERMRKRITLDVMRSKHFSFRKPNSDLLNINRQSNHPPSILKHLPQMMQARLSNLSSDEDKCTNAKFSYEKVLKKWFQQFTLFPPSNFPAQKRKRSRNMIWFKPPSVCTCPQT